MLCGIFERHEVVVLRKKRYHRMKQGWGCLLLFCLFVCSVSGCGRIREEERPNENLTEITVVLDWTTNTKYSGLYVAMKKGYFEKEGLDISVVEPPEDGATGMVASGEAEFGIAYQNELAENFSSDNQLPVAAVATLLQHNQTGFISLARYEINTPANIPDHTVAYSGDIIEQTVIRTLIEQSGGDFSRVKMEETYVDDVAETMGFGLQVVPGDYGWDGIACERQGLDINFMAWRDLNETFDYYGPLLIANTEFLTKQPDMARAFLSAVKQGYQDAVMDPAEAARILLEQEPDLDQGLVESSQRYMSQQYIADSMEFGVIDAERWNRYYNWINAMGFYQTPIPEGVGFTNEFLDG